MISKLMQLFHRTFENGIKMRIKVGRRRLILIIIWTPNNYKINFKFYISSNVY